MLRTFNRLDLDEDECAEWHENREENAQVLNAEKDRMFYNITSVINNIIKNKKIVLKWGDVVRVLISFVIH